MLEHLNRDFRLEHIRRMTIGLDINADYDIRKMNPRAIYHLDLSNISKLLTFGLRPF